jgi:hypothetical protein
MLKPTPVKNLRGRIIGYQLDLAGISATGATKAECLASWDKLAETASVYAHARRYDWAADGSLFSLYFTGNGWRYDIVHPGSTHVSSCQMSGDRRDALRYYEQHLDQYGRAAAPVARPCDNPAVDWAVAS